MIVEERLVVGRLSQDRGGVLADEADDRRVCEGDVEGHISTRPSPYKPIRSLNSRRMYCRTSRWRLMSWFTVRPPCLGMTNTLKPHRCTLICQLCEDVAVAA